MQEQVKGKRGSAGERLLGLICKNTPIREEEEQEASLTPEDPRRRGRVMLLEETEDLPEEYEEEDMRLIAANIKEKDQTKKPVLWERTEMTNAWHARLRNDKKAENAAKTNGSSLTLGEPPKDIGRLRYEFYNQAPKKDLFYKQTYASKIPLLTNNSSSSAHAEGLQNCPKVNRHINNIFMQSSLQ